MEFSRRVTLYLKSMINFKYPVSECLSASTIRSYLKLLIDNDIPKETIVEDLKAYDACLPLNRLNEILGGEQW